MAKIAKALVVFTSKAPQGALFLAAFEAKGS